MKSLVTALASVLVLSLVGCGDDAQTHTTAADETTTTATTGSDTQETGAGTTEAPPAGDAPTTGTTTSP